MPVEPLGVVWGALVAAAVVIVAERVRLLTRSGAIAAWVVGAIVFGCGGWPYAAPLLAFFVTSSLWTRANLRTRYGSGSRLARGGPRDAWQVLANGGVPVAILLAAVLLPPGARPSSRDWYLLYLCAIAAVTADTWSTEVGGLFGRAPRLITTWKAVPPGTSGGVTIAGTLAALVGAAVIVAVGRAVWPSGSQYYLWPADAAEMLAIAWSGFLAALADSVLGASAQAQYRCSECGRVVETRMHCGATGARVRGLPFVGNDLVNFVAALLSVPAGWYLLNAYAWPIR